MAAHIETNGVAWVASLLLGATASAQQSDWRAPDALEAERPALRSNQAMLVLDHQVLPVEGDKPIDLMGFHVHSQIAERLYWGAGMSAPLFKGAYGGFATFDIGVHAMQRLTQQLFATAGLALGVGVGAGGRNVEITQTLAGTGGFAKGYVGFGL